MEVKLEGVSCLDAIGWKGVIVWRSDPLLGRPSEALIRLEIGVDHVNNLKSPLIFHIGIVEESVLGDQFICNLLSLRTRPICSGQWMQGGCSLRCELEDCHLHRVERGLVGDDDQVTIL